MSAAAAAAAASESSSAAETMINIARQVGEKAQTLDRGMLEGVMDKVTKFTKGEFSFEDYMKAIGEFYDFLETIHLSHLPLLVNPNNREAIKVPYFDSMIVCKKTHKKILIEVTNGIRTKENAINIYNRVFGSIFEQYTDQIIMGYVEIPKNEEDEVIIKDDWIRSNSIIFQMNEKRRFSLSCFYNTSLRLQTLAEEQMQNSSDEERANCSALIYPELMILHFYRILEMSLGIDPKRILIKSSITSLETYLGLADGEAMIVNENTVAKFRTLFETMASSYNGGKMPNALKTPNARVITQAINKTVGNAELQQQAYRVFSKITTQIDGSDGSIEGYFSSVINAINDPGLKEAVLTTIKSVTSSVGELKVQNS